MILFLFIFPRPTISSSAKTLAPIKAVIESPGEKGPSSPSRPNRTPLSAPARLKKVSLSSDPFSPTSAASDWPDYEPLREGGFLRQATLSPTHQATLMRISDKAPPPVPTSPRPTPSDPSPSPRLRSPLSKSNADPLTSTIGELPPRPAQIFNFKNTSDICEDKLRDAQPEINQARATLKTAHLADLTSIEAGHYKQLPRSRETPRQDAGLNPADQCFLLSLPPKALFSGGSNSPVNATSHVTDI